MDQPASTLDRLLEESGDGILLGDLHGRITYGNQTAARLLGRSAREMSTLTYMELAASAMLPDGSPFPGGHATFARRIAGGERFEGEEFALDRGASGRVLLSISAHPMHDGSGRLIGSASRLVDLTERRRLEAEVRQADHLQSLGTYVGSIANDFNNILTAILGNISLAKLDTTTNEEIHRTLNYVEKAAGRARDLATQLLELAGSERPRGRPTMIQDLVRDAAVRALRAAPIQVEFELGSEPLVVVVDRTALERALRNVVGSLARTVKDGGRITFKACAVELPQGALPGLSSGHYVRVSVSDDQFRASPEAIERVLSLALATDEPDVGLDLAAARTVVQEHGGTMGLEAGEGSGLACHVYLPCMPAGSVEPAELPATPVRGTGRILVMDDQEMVRQVADRMLAYLGYEPESAPDGATAIQAYVEARDSGRPFDAVILDLEVPDGMGGQEAITRLREVDPGVRAFLSTGYANDPVALNLEEYGFVAAVRKPYEIVRLSVTLDRVLKARG